MSRKNNEKKTSGSNGLTEMQLLDGQNYPSWAAPSLPPTIQAFFDGLGKQMGVNPSTPSTVREMGWESFLYRRRRGEQKKENNEQEEPTDKQI